MPNVPPAILEFINVFSMEIRRNKLRERIQRGDVNLSVDELQILVFYESINDGAHRSVAFDMCSYMSYQSMVEYLQRSFDGYENLNPKGEPK